MPTNNTRPAHGAHPITTLPMCDDQAKPYLPPGLRYQRLYTRLRNDGVSVAEALLATLKARYGDLTAAITEYEATHIVAS